MPKGVFTQAEQQLLWIMNDHVRGVEPGGFYTALIEAALKADEDNLRLLGLGFPDVEAAVRGWRASPDGWGIGGVD